MGSTAGFGTSIGVATPPKAPSHIYQSGYDDFGFSARPPQQQFQPQLPTQFQPGPPGLGHGATNQYGGTQPIGSNYSYDRTGMPVLMPQQQNQFQNPFQFQQQPQFFQPQFQPQFFQPQMNPYSDPFYFQGRMQQPSYSVPYSNAPSFQSVLRNATNSIFSSMFGRSFKEGGEVEEGIDSLLKK